MTTDKPETMPDGRDDKGERAADTKKWKWLTTAPNPRSHRTGWDAGQRGWRLHLVDGAQLTQYVDGGAFRGAALCGLRPAHGWGLDLFIDEPCDRCYRIAEKRSIEMPKLD